MVFTTRTLMAVLLAFTAPRQASSIQVSPNSPCAAVCVDREGLDLSDPNSSNTHGLDITCKDAHYPSTTAGVKWQKCMTCLQTSAFYQGSESDLGHFLYNLRYNFNYCIFGWPNNTAIGSNPCQTSTACGALKSALLNGDMDPKTSKDYGYCDVDGSAMTGPFYQKCLSCIHGFSDQVIVRNGLIALEAGCVQQPAPGKVLGLSDSIFSRTEITVTDPGKTEASAQQGAGQGGGSSVPITTIVPIAISAVIALAAIAAIIFVCVRRRRNRRARAQHNISSGLRGGFGHHRKSSLSFRCQTHLSPLSPKFFPGSMAAHDSDSSALDSRPRHITSSPRVKPEPWRPASSVISHSLSPVAEKQGGGEPLSAVSEKHQMFLSEKQQLHQLTTAGLPAAPRNVHSPNVATRPSPISAKTPTSATQLLPSTGRLSTIAPYVPSDYAGVRQNPHQQQHYQHQQQSPVSPVARSPQNMSAGHHNWGWAVSTTNTTSATAGTPPPPPSKTQRGMGRKASRESGSPTETVSIQTSFPGPPRN